MKKWLLREYKKLLIKQYNFGEITSEEVKRLYNEYELELKDVGDFWPEDSKHWTILDVGD